MAVGKLLSLRFKTRAKPPTYVHGGRQSGRAEGAVSTVNTSPNPIAERAEGEAEASNARPQPS